MAVRQLSERYEHGVGKIVVKSGRWFVLYLAIIGVMAFLFRTLPTSFLPQEDRGVFMTQIQLPPGLTQQQTLKVLEKVEAYYMTQEKENVVSVFTAVGNGPGGNGQNVAQLFVRLKDWDERPGVQNSAGAIVERATRAFRRINEARVFSSTPPAISGLGNASGFDMELQDRAGLGHDALMAARDTLLA